MIHSYSENTIKEAVADVRVLMEDFELPIMAGKSKKALDEYMLVFEATIDHLYTRLGLGSYAPYLDHAKVLRED